MIDPISILAGAVTTYIVPKALEKIGEKVGEATLAKSSEAIAATRKAVQEKLEVAGTATLLERVVTQPTDQNIQVLQAELVTQLQDDQEFAERLQDFVNKIHVQSPSLQVVLDGLRAKGKLEIGNVRQSYEGKPGSRQLFGRNWGVDGDIKIGDVTQENH